MDRDRALRILKGVQFTLEQRGVKHAALFGSIARGQGQAWSDIDVLVTPQPGRRLNLFELGAIQSILEDAFRGRRVDIVVEPVQRAEVREAINRDRVHAF